MSPPKAAINTSEFHSRFKVFHELMATKISEILLVASPYDAFIIEEDGRFASRIINEYRGLNLSRPPRIIRTSSASKALSILKEKKFDMVITMPHLDEMDAFSLGTEIKKIIPELPVILLYHSASFIEPFRRNRDISGIDRIYIWSGSSDLLLALVKNIEDHQNVDSDTKKAGVRVLILVEDSPFSYSSILPLLYKEVVRQTQSVLETGVNEDHKLLTMRTRPKILLALNHEEAMEFYTRYKPYLCGIISDAQFPRAGDTDINAGYDFLSLAKKEIPDIPLLLLSSDSSNKEKAGLIPAVFIDKNSPDLLRKLHDFFQEYLGFGDFLFRMPNGTVIDSASTLNDLEKKLENIPEESLMHHARKNNFSTWIMGRAEITFASKLRNIVVEDFNNAEELRHFLISSIRQLLRWRQKGVVVRFINKYFDPDIIDFAKIGQGSLGGKARGLAFMSASLQNYPELHDNFPKIDIKIPKTLAICTDGFESFVEKNKLYRFLEKDFPDNEINSGFMKADFPDWLINELEDYLRKVNYPLAIRSSSLLEDGRFQPFAGLYETYMIPNNHSKLSKRVEHLINAIKMVYASTCYEGPRAFLKRISNRPHQESMAVIIQEVAGKNYGDFFYPAVSGVAQTYNFYPVSPMKPWDGIVHIALGLGKSVMDGEKGLSFSPKYPNILPQFSTTDDILSNAQRYYYALRMKNYPEDLNLIDHPNLERRFVEDTSGELPLTELSSTYVREEHRIRDTAFIKGTRILTFSQIVKYNIFSFPELLSYLLEIGRENMGCPVIIEFSINMNAGNKKKIEFFLLQIRPMTAGNDIDDINITGKDIKESIAYSSQTLGNGVNDKIYDIVYVKPNDFKSEATIKIAEEINLINSLLVSEKRSYLLAGPGRWGSADRWLGIPVRWKDISGVGAIIELRNANIKADSSQGSHFFQNLTSMGIFYLTINENSEDKFDWNWVESLTAIRETIYLRHVRVEKPLIIKIRGDTSRGVILKTGGKI